MSDIAWLQMGILFVLLLAVVKPLGDFVARVLQGERTLLHPVLAPVERLALRTCGVRGDRDMGWDEYALAMLAFNGAGLVAVYALQQLQGWLPLNPLRLGAVRHDTAINTAVSFATNTNWQSYSGETMLSYTTQMLGLTVQNFASAATGIAVLAALARGLARRGRGGIGNFWVDVVRVTLYILLPLSLLLALGLVSQGVVQTFAPPVAVTRMDAGGEGAAATLADEVVPRGPAASQIAIKQLGTNGGGFFNANAAHPFENPTPLANFLELLAILALPAALCATFGRLVGDPRQGRALLAAMLVLFVPLLVGAALAERSPNPMVAAASREAGVALLPDGNLEGKEVRIGVGGSVLWAVATTAASNGSVNAMHDSFSPLGGAALLGLMQMGEVVFGGVGSGLYGMLAFVIVAVFVAGLMVGRTPEYLGKKVEAFEMKMATLAILGPCFAVLVGTAIAVSTKAGVAGIFNPGVHGFSEILYAYTSAGNNNGSAFAGLGANTPFYNLSLAVAMLIGRYVPALAMLGIAGSMAGKKVAPASAGTLPTHVPLFIGMLVAVVLVVGALTFVPALALGPVVEFLQARH